MDGQLFFLQNLGLALLLGGLIGLEREKRQEGVGLHEFGGIRTMALVGMLGNLVYSLFGDNIVIFSIFTAGLILLVLAAYFMSSYFNKNTGTTTEIAAFFVYLIGVLTAMGEIVYASVITLAVVLLLYFKDPLHKFAYSVAKEELYDAIKFVAILFVILPLLPNQTFGPLEVLNPYIIWLMVVLISGISFVSYIAIKWLGTKQGIGIGGFLGGLISSTAVSMSFSQMSRKSKRIVNPFIFGILIASSAMFFRVLLEVAVLNTTLLSYLYVPMISMGVVGIVISIYYWFNRKGQSVKFSEKDLKLKSPLQLWAALQFGLLFAALIFISKFASIYFGDQGIYLTAFVSGFVDVDAITVSMANLSSTSDITMRAAAIAVTIATIMNTLTKGAIVLFFGSRAVGVRVVTVMLLIGFIGILSIYLFDPTAYGIAAI